MWGTSATWEGERQETVWQWEGYDGSSSDNSGSTGNDGNWEWREYGNWD